MATQARLDYIPAGAVRAGLIRDSDIGHQWCIHVAVQLPEPDSE